LTMLVGHVRELWRFPVKSMQGEETSSLTVTDGGVLGDRAYALIDAADGKVVSAKNPRKWGRLLTWSARFVEEPVAGATVPPVAIETDDGSVVHSDDPDVDGVLSRLLGRDVHLAAAGGAADGPRRMEEVWPDVEGLAPADFIASTQIVSDTPDETVSDITVAMAAPPGTFFDLAALHLLTTSTLSALRSIAPGSDFDVRRYRPNVLVETEGEGFVENDWVERTVSFGPSGAAMRVDLPTMRCIMTTLAQPGLERDKASLQTIARNNRIEIFGGQWACAGSYGSVASPGPVAVGDEVSLG